MVSYVTIYCISSLLLLNLVGGKPVSSLQSLKELLEEESNAPYLDSEETEIQGKELNAENAAFSTGALHSWDPNSRDSALSAKENALRTRVLNGMKNHRNLPLLELFGQDVPLQTQKEWHKSLQ
ncbi:hypothetical protein AGOR_G00134860 [Albula goreensis]|uniref:Uncharacterized protein n=1 Tax=Albula goreensis TaxID=1534307 RepID=A0A8T3D8Y7_9TELE|nr:hypothetical protein AGOR_G00134860 [Albula goreensis]